MRITAHPQPTGGLALNRRADGKTCGLQGPTAITCAGSATCAAVIAAADERLYAGCFEKEVLGIATSCKDISTPKGAPSQGVLTCGQHENCAARYWHLRPSTGEFDRPYATEYFCNADGFVQVTGTYQPSEFPWKTILANDMPTGVAPRPIITGLIDSPPLGPSPASESTTGPAPGVIAGAAVGGVIGVLLLIGLVWFWRRRRLSDSALASKDQGHESPSPQSQSQPLGSANVDVKAEATRSTITEATPGYYQPDAYERTDVPGGLPSSDELRRMKPGAQFGGLRGAPSVMTDLSETLTIGDADGNHGVDDIHVIGHGR